MVSLGNRSISFKCKSIEFNVYKFIFIIRRVKNNKMDVDIRPTNPRASPNKMIYYKTERVCQELALFNRAIV